MLQQLASVARQAAASMSRRPWRSRHRPLIEAAALRHSLNPDIVEAVVLVESSDNPRAYRYEPGFWTKYLEDDPAWNGSNPRVVSASYGLCQVLYPVAVEHGLVGAAVQLYQPACGLEYGCRHLSYQYRWAHGDIKSALAAYNGGRVKNEPGRVPLRNEKYMRKVLARLEAIRAA